jgi:hypothetical protein
MSKPPLHNGHGKTPKLSPSCQQIPVAKTAKPPQQWHLCTSPETKRKPKTPLVKQPSKASPSRSRTTRIVDEKSLATPMRNAQVLNPLQSPLQSRVHETSATLGSPTKKTTRPALARVELGPLRRGISAPSRSDDYYSSLLKTSGLSPSPRSKVSNTPGMPSKNHIEPDIVPICGSNTPAFENSSSDIDVRCFFRSRSNRESDEEPAKVWNSIGQGVISERQQPRIPHRLEDGSGDTTFGLVIPMVGDNYQSAVQEEEDWQAFLREMMGNRQREVAPCHARGNVQSEETSGRRFRRDSMGQPPGPPMRATALPDEDTGNAGFPTEFTYPTAEEHILAIDPGITLHTPISRRSATVSDPVRPTVPTHEECSNDVQQ